MIIEKEQLLNATMILEVKSASLILRAINNKIRQVILKHLEQNGQLTVTEIMIHLRQEQSITSQHLAILRRARIVSTKRLGKRIYYAHNESRLKQIYNFTQSLLADSLTVSNSTNIPLNQITFSPAKPFQS